MGMAYLKKVALTLFLAATAAATPLLLSPLIKNGQITEALQKSNVTCNLVGGDFLESYSGYITVDDVNDGNLFFWFIKSETDPDNAPIILWLNGGPGVSSMFGFFAGNGPLIINNDHITKPTVSKRMVGAWTQKYSMLYIDSPIGVGFSTGKKAHYPSTVDQVADHLHIFLKQFFTLFHTHATNDFYIAGTSYAGKYIPALAEVIHTGKKSKPSLNLQGIAIGSGLVDSEVMLPEHSDMHLSLGLITPDVKTKMDSETLTGLTEMKAGNIMKGYQAIIKGQFTLFTQSSGLGSQSYVGTQQSPQAWTWIMHMAREEVGKALHVYPNKYIPMNRDVNQALVPDFMFNTRPHLTRLLNDGYKVLLFHGNMDGIVSTPMSDALIEKMTWTDSPSFKATSRFIWKEDPTNRRSHINGYATSYKNMNYAIIRGAGHSSSADEPGLTFDLIDAFISYDATTSNMTSILTTSATPFDDTYAPADAPPDAPVDLSDIW